MYKGGVFALLILSLFHRIFKSGEGGLSESATACRYAHTKLSMLEGTIALQRLLSSMFNKKLVD